MEPAGQVQLQIEGLARGAAHDAAAALRELIVPEAEAVAVFENGGAWKIDAYYGDETTAAAADEIRISIQDTINRIAKENFSKDKGSQLQFPD